MTHSDILVFLSVVRNGNLSQTAANMGISVSAVGKHIDTLDNEFGAQLVIRDRGKSGIVLTDAGRSFVNLAHQWDETWCRMEENFFPDSVPRFTVAVAKSVYKFVISDVHAAYHSHASHLNLVVTTPSLDEAFEGLKEGTIDLAIFAEYIENQYITALPLYTEEVQLLCSAGSGFPATVRASELDVSREIYMGYDRDTSWGRAFSLWHDYWFSGKQPLLVTDNSSQLNDLISGFGAGVWSVAPVSIVQPIIKSGAAETRVLLDPPHPRTVYALFANSEIYAPHSAMLMRDIKERLRDRPGFQLII